MKNTDPAYKDASLDLDLRVEAPSYEVCLDWMLSAPDREMTVDFWARGNFVRRLLHHRRTEITPLLIEAQDVAQMRWVYRRLALMGVPVEFVYTGPLKPARPVIHWMPMDIPIDSGWGYGVLARTVETRTDGRKWWPVLGWASLLPPVIADWLAEEAAQAFVTGRVFISPAALVGIELTHSARVLDAYSAIGGGVISTREVDAAMAVLDLDLPWIDGMPLEDVDRLLADHADELAPLRTSFGEVIEGYSVSEERRREAIARFNDAVSALHRSARFVRMRSFVQSCKGQLASFPMGLGVLASVGAVYTADPFAGAAVLGATGYALRELWTQATASARASLQSPLRLLINVGSDRAEFKPRMRVGVASRRRAPRGLPTTASHWLCPPTAGMGCWMFDDATQPSLVPIDTVMAMKGPRLGKE